MKHMNHMYIKFKQKEKLKIHSYETYESYVTSLLEKIKIKKFILMKHMNHMYQVYRNKEIKKFFLFSNSYVSYV